jgi:ADP-heptose:LPS heptosyltransferase
MSFDPKWAIKGGIGDFLQCVPFVLEHPDHHYVVASHYNRAPEFFSALGVRIKEESFARIEDISECPRQLFFNNNPFGKSPRSFATNWPIIGLHLGASKYSNSLAKRYGFPPKNLPPSILTSLLSNPAKFSLCLFGESSELDMLLPEWRRTENYRLKIISEGNIAVSLSYVANCDYFIGSDSGLKTMSSMLRIPTVVWMGDHKDESTEETFINPYVKAGVMSVFRYRDLSLPEEVQAGVEFSLGKLLSLE